jgi:hypothetical protein
MTDAARQYAFPHTGADERRRLELFAERLDPLTVRRIKALDLAPGARCLEVGGGRGSIARWLCEYVGRLAGLRRPTWRPASCPSCHCRISTLSAMT